MTMREPSPIMQAAARAAKVVASWSQSKQEYAERVMRANAEIRDGLPPPGDR